MLTNSHAFSSFSVSDLKKAKDFYENVLGITVKELPDMGIELHIAGSTPVFVYPKDNHVPATFTVLNFPVESVEISVDALIAKGIVFEQYPEMHTNEKGITTYEKDSIAWFKDPAGNIFSVITKPKA